MQLQTQNTQMEEICTKAEENLKESDKWVQQSLATLEDTKNNFAYIYSKLKYIKQMEEQLNAPKQ